MPLLVAGMVNLLAVPVGADQIGFKVQGDVPVQLLDGTARNASRLLDLPFGPEDCTSHSTADDGAVPLEVITGDPDVYPNVNELLATSDRVGVSVEPSWACSTRR